MIKKIKKLCYTILIAIYDWQLKRIAKAYWKEVKDELKWEDWKWKLKKWNVTAAQGSLRKIK